MTTSVPPSWQQAAFAPDPNPSFADLLRRVEPSLLPQVPHTTPVVPHGTTIVAMRFADGVLVGGDRRATEGYTIADRRIEKVFPADSYSAVAIAGAAGPAIDMVRLLQLELEHYEKLEGEILSLEAKANRLATLIKQNLPMAMQGIVVVPLFGGYDTRRAEGRIFRYDAIGGRYEDIDYHATGSGGLHARASLKKRYAPGLDRAAAVSAAVEALMDAADEDTATGGPDLRRGIFPVIALVTAEGYRTVEDDELRAVTEALIAARGEV
jgi:proteasome beta subunit